MIKSNLGFISHSFWDTGYHLFTVARSDFPGYLKSIIFISSEKASATFY